MVTEKNVRNGKESHLENFLNESVMHFLGGQTGDRVTGHTHFEFGEFLLLVLILILRCVLNVDEIDNEKSWMGEEGCEGSRIYSGSHVSNGI